MADDVVVQKLASIDRCLASVRRYVAGDLGRLADPMVLDAVVLNIQRACELSIDGAATLGPSAGNCWRLIDV